MCTALSPEAFFSLTAFEHRCLFDGCEFVWEALSRLPSYLEQASLGKIQVKVPASATLIFPEKISIGEGTLIEPGAFIQGPCIIGRNCQIRQGAYIRGGVILADHCVVGHVTELKNTIFLNHAAAAHFNYVGDSILGNQVNLGAGAKCANLRLDHSPVSIRTQGKKFVTGLKKLGAILGDGAQIGCNAVLNPGSFLGKNAGCYPLLSVHGYVPDGKIIMR